MPTRDQQLADAKSETQRLKERIEIMQSVLALAAESFDRLNCPTNAQICRDALKD